MATNSAHKLRSEAAEHVNAQHSRFGIRNLPVESESILDRPVPDPPEWLTCEDGDTETTCHAGHADTEGRGDKP